MANAAWGYNSNKNPKIIQVKGAKAVAILLITFMRR